MTPQHWIGLALIGAGVLVHLAAMVTRSDNDGCLTMLLLMIGLVLLLTVP